MPLVEGVLGTLWSLGLLVERDGEKEKVLVFRRERGREWVKGERMHSSK